jgi:hypothetical protein
MRTSEAAIAVPAGSAASSARLNLPKRKHYVIAEQLHGALDQSSVKRAVLSRIADGMAIAPDLPSAIWSTTSRIPMNNQNREQNQQNREQQGGQQRQEGGSNERREEGGQNREER